MGEEGPEQVLRGGEEPATFILVCRLSLALSWLLAS